MWRYVTEREQSARASLRLATYQMRYEVLRQMVEDTCGLRLSMDTREGTIRPPEGETIAPNARLGFVWREDELFCIRRVPREPTQSIINDMLRQMPGWDLDIYAWTQPPTVDEFMARIWPALHMALSMVFQGLWWSRAMQGVAALTHLQNNASEDAVQTMHFWAGPFKIKYRQRHANRTAVCVRWPQGLSPEACNAMEQWVWRADHELRFRAKSRMSRRGHRSMSIPMECGLVDVDRGLRLLARMNEALHELQEAFAPDAPTRPI